MFDLYELTEHGPRRLTVEDGGIPGSAVWIDLFNPSDEEERTAEAFLGTDLPTPDEIKEIEFSSRFYREGGTVVMTISVLTGIDSGKPLLAPVTFVVAGSRLATLRYHELRSFKHFLAQSEQSGGECNTLPLLLLGLIDAIIDRIADIIEDLVGHVDRLNGEVFHRQDVSRRERRLDFVISDIGKRHEIATKARESLTSLERLVHFVGRALPEIQKDKAANNLLRTAWRDICSLQDHAGVLSGKIAFLLDATLGLISVEQNLVVRVLTVAATFFFPPTLIATIYGMNFDRMPELHWPWGYPLSVVAMVASAVLPYLYFKKKGWL